MSELNNLRVANVLAADAAYISALELSIAQNSLREALTRLYEAEDKLVATTPDFDKDVDVAKLTRLLEETSQELVETSDRNFDLNARIRYLEEELEDAEKGLGVVTEANAELHLSILGYASDNDKLLAQISKPKLRT